MTRKNSIVNYRGILFCKDNNEVVGIKGKFIREERTILKELSLKDIKNIHKIPA